jgi:hypothetical protein
MKVLERTRAMVTCGKWSRDGQMNEWMDVDQMTRTAQRETDTPRPYMMRNGPLDKDNELDAKLLTFDSDKPQERKPVK